MTSRMTATDELRRLLDERGVEWVASGTDTCWTSAGGYPMRAWETANGTHMRVADLTPEQAIEATLGSDLKAENAKLRELVRDMAVVICVYDQCATVDDCPPALPMFTDKMRELGIEVEV